MSSNNSSFRLSLYSITDKTAQCVYKFQHMKSYGKSLLWVFVALVIALALAITFTIGWRPFVGPRTRPLTSRKFESTPARLARGEYLVMSVTDCMDCHA